MWAATPNTMSILGADSTNARLLLGTLSDTFTPISGANILGPDEGEVKICSTNVNDTGLPFCLSVSGAGESIYVDGLNTQNQNIEMGSGALNLTGGISGPSSRAGTIYGTTTNTTALTVGSGSGTPTITWDSTGTDPTMIWKPTQDTDADGTSGEWELSTEVRLNQGLNLPINKGIIIPTSLTGRGAAIPANLAYYAINNNAYDCDGDGTLEPGPQTLRGYNFIEGSAGGRANTSELQFGEELAGHFCNGPGQPRQVEWNWDFTDKSGNQFRFFEATIVQDSDGTADLASWTLRNSVDKVGIRMGGNGAIDIGSNADISYDLNVSGSGQLWLGGTTGGRVLFEGTADGNETQILATDPTADNDITLPDKSGVVATANGGASNGIAYWGSTDAAFDTGNEVCVAHGFACQDTYAVGTSISVACSTPHIVKFLAFCS